jgi:hypothetical protein
MRYDLPDPPGRACSDDIAQHALSTLTSQHLTSAIVVGYGPGELVTPVADAVRAVLGTARLILHEALRVENGLYWSYICDDPTCCPPEGTPFDVAAHPASRAMAATGTRVLADRHALVASIGPVSGSLARTMRQATLRAERTAIRLVASHGPRALDKPGRAAVREAISAYRAGRSLRPDARHAWLALVLLDLRIRDDAWARMDPVHRDAHARLWADTVRRAQPGYVAAPATLLAFTAWQNGEGALANVALDRALADNPDYTLALLLREAVNSGLPPSMAVAPMTPEEVAASYAEPGSADGTDSPLATR